MINKLFFAIICICFLSACYSDNLQELTPSFGLKDNACDTAGVMTYTYHIAPIMEASCGTKTACHGTSNKYIDLSTYTGVKKIVTNGKLISCITWTGTASRMPKYGSKLDDCTIRKIQKWVDAGALNN